MEILEAYQRTLDAANGLHADGIPMKIVPSRSTSKSPDDRLPRDKWVNITFLPRTPEEAKAIRQKTVELGWAGIRFDNGGSSGRRDWELDWSFILEDTPNAEWEKAGSDVEDMIEGSDFTKE